VKKPPRGGTAGPSDGSWGLGGCGMLPSGLQPRCPQVGSLCPEEFQVPPPRQTRSPIFVPCEDAGCFLLARSWHPSPWRDR
jgi:hypothetical protein